VHLDPVGDRIEREYIREKQEPPSKAPAAPEQP
jgi:hypothetical protein